MAGDSRALFSGGHINRLLPHKHRQFSLSDTNLPEMTTTPPAPPTEDSPRQIYSRARPPFRDIFSKHSESAGSPGRSSESPASHSSPTNLGVSPPQIFSPSARHLTFLKRGDGSPRPWHSTPRKKWDVPKEQADNYLQTRIRIAQAVTPVLDIAGDLAHEALLIGVEILPFVPVAGLDGAAKILLNIWDAIQQVDSNRLACLRLAERCADILVAVREEIALMGNSVKHELQIPLIKIKETFFEIYLFLQRQIHQPFFKRYLKRDEMLQDIMNCNTLLADCLDHFDRSILLRIMNKFSSTPPTSAVEPPEPLIRQEDEPGSADPLDDLAIGVINFKTEPAPVSLTENEIRANLRKTLFDQNVHDRANDLNDLRSLLRLAVETDNDADMIKILQIGKDEMPDAIKTLLRALEKHIQSGVNRSNPTSPHASPLFRANTWPSDHYKEWKLDLLDREFMEKQIDALKRQVTGPLPNLPNWTITKYELDLKNQIGSGYFSNVYRATWRQRGGITVAVKVLNASTVQDAFTNEISVWKTLRHTNLLELYGASSAQSSMPWFLVSPYMKNGNLSDYLKRVSWISGVYDVTSVLLDVDCLRMMYDITNGMRYLHEHRIVHGDLRATNVLVDDQKTCLVADFGQSKFHASIKHTDPPPHHALRWQAPELMSGRSLKTKEIDVYAFGITCVEILTMGIIPWPTLQDDEVKGAVLKEYARPPFPVKTAELLGVHTVMQDAWAESPASRLSFKKLAKSLAHLRGNFTPTNIADNSPRIVVSEVDAEHGSLPPPDSAQSTPAGASGNLLLDFQDSDHKRRNTSPAIYSQDPQIQPNFNHRQSVPSIMENITEVETKPQDPSKHSVTSVAKNPRESRDEFVYRMSLKHDYHRSLCLPLWTPSIVELGDIGYLSKPSGKFVKLCNALDPLRSSDGFLQDVLPLSRFGNVLTERQTLHKRTISTRGLEAMTRILSFGDTVTYSPPQAKNRFSLSDNESSFMALENSIHHFMEDLKVCKKWFRSYWKHILELYAEKHVLQKEDLIMVVEMVVANEYALLVNHGTSPDRDVQFDVYASRHPGQPWGTFNFQSVSSPKHATGSVTTIQPPSITTKVSLIGDPNLAVLLARLRFQPDVLEPTLL